MPRNTGQVFDAVVLHTGNRGAGLQNQGDKPHDAVLHRGTGRIIKLLTDNEPKNTDKLVELSPEEIVLRDPVNFAMTIRDDRQVTPLVVVDVSKGVSHLSTSAQLASGNTR